MKQKRRNHSAEFKARVALEALKGVKTVQEIAAANHLHPVQVTQWKAQLSEEAASLFEKGGGRGQEAAASGQASVRRQSAARPGSRREAPPGR